MKVSKVQASLTQGSGTIAELERTLDLRVITLLEGFVRVEFDEDHIVINIVKDMGLNLAMLPL